MRRRRLALQRYRLHPPSLPAQPPPPPPPPPQQKKRKEKYSQSLKGVGSSPGKSTLKFSWGLFLHHGWKNMRVATIIWESKNNLCNVKKGKKIFIYFADNALSPSNSIASRHASRPHKRFFGCRMYKRLWQSSGPCEWKILPRMCWQDATGIRHVHECLWLYIRNL